MAGKWHEKAEGMDGHAVNIKKQEGRKMTLQSLFRIEVLDGGVKVTPSELLSSMPRDQQIATIKEQIRNREAALQKINNPTEANTGEPEASGHHRDEDKRELEVAIVILKNFLKRLLESHWEVLKP